MKRRLSLLVFFLFSSLSLFAQDNYEIQVYPSETVSRGITMVELHSNYTANGQGMANGVRPTQSAGHETVEITHGFTPWFEVGFYFFTNITNGYGWQWVGDHIRPRIRVPDTWHWPVGASLSTEFGYQRREYSEDTWTLEIRPIVDKDFPLVYLSFNPTLGKSFRGVNEGKGFDFEPNFKAAFHMSKKVDAGVEYYGSTGTLFNADPVQQQVHALFVAADLNLSPKWEINFGPGWGLTKATDGLVLKLILGRRFGKPK